MGRNRLAGTQVALVGRWAGRKVGGLRTYIVIAAVRVVEFILLQRPGQSWPSRYDEQCELAASWGEVRRGALTDFTYTFTPTPSALPCFSARHGLSPNSPKPVATLPTVSCLSISPARVLISIVTYIIPVVVTISLRVRPC